MNAHPAISHPPNPGRVVITGIGIVCAIGQGVDDVTAALRAGKNGIGGLPIAGTSKEMSDIPVAALENFDLPHNVDRLDSLPDTVRKRLLQCVRRSPLPLQVAAIGSAAAWTQSQLHLKGIAPTGISIVIAGHNINQRYAYEANTKFHQTPEYLAPSYALHFLDTDHIGTLSEIFNIRGEGLNVGGASASGNVGIIQGYRLVRWGMAEVCMVVGAMIELSPIEFQAFYNIGAMGGRKFKDRPTEACRPFDQDHEGFIYGQGSGCIILEAESSAKRRGVPILAEIAGGAIYLDANRTSDPSQEGEMQAMRMALQDAGVASDDVDYLNAHGTSSPLGDTVEIAAIQAVFPNARSQPLINSTKSLVGHCLGAAGVIEAIATIIQMREGFVHPNLNLDHPLDHECRLVGKTSEAANIQIALSNSFGFGGINTAIVLKK